MNKRVAILIAILLLIITTTNIFYANKQKQNFIKSYQLYQEKTMLINNILSIQKMLNSYPDINFCKKNSNVYQCILNKNQFLIFQNSFFNSIVDINSFYLTKQNKKIEIEVKVK